jgi:hypothetical protein
MEPHLVRRAFTATGPGRLRGVADATYRELGRAGRSAPSGGPATVLPASVAPTDPANQDPESTCHHGSRSHRQADPARTALRLARGERGPMVQSAPQGGALRRGPREMAG